MRKLRWILAAVVVVVTVANGWAQGIDREHAAEVLKEAHRLITVDGGQLWGQSLQAPLLFVDRSSRSVVAGRADGEKRLKPSRVDGVFEGRLTDDVNPANTAVEWSGVRWTMLQWPLPDNDYDRRRLIAHELFHNAQPRLGFELASPDNPHLDDEVGRIWLRLEMRALVEALLRDGKESVRAIEDALLFRRHRRAQIDGAAASERALEMNEGLAEYTGLMLCGMPRRWLPDRAAIRLEREEREASFQRTFAYATGPAWALLLDQHAARWRATATAKDDLSDLLAAALGFATPKDLSARALKRGESYGLGRVRAHERERAQERSARQEELHERFVASPLLVVPNAGQNSYSFDPGKVETLPGVGQVFATARVSDAWGVLEVGSGGALQHHDGTWRVPAPSDNSARPLAGDGWTLQLSKGWTVGHDERDGDRRLEKAEPR